MKDPNRPDRPRSRVKSGSKNILFFMIALVVVLTCSFFLFMKYKHSEIIQSFSENYLFNSTSQPLVTARVAEEKSPKSEQKLSVPSPTTTGAPVSNVDFAATQLEQQLLNQTNLQKQSITESSEAPMAPSSFGNQAKGASYRKLIDDLNAFYTHLDQQPYMQDFHLKEPSKVHFSKLLQVLVNNPPVITRETDDYFTLLKNTAHFFRVLGKDNILVLKGILDREKDSFETILKTFYSLLEHPEYLKEEYSLTIPRDNLYDYAGFFLNSIGGRLYLFRRDSASRMTISYYAVLIIDKANRQGNSRLGIDLRPSIDSLIEEIENTGGKLKLKDEYLDTLYDLKENYGNGG